MKTLKLLQNGEPGVLPLVRLTDTIPNNIEADVSHDAVALQAYWIYVKRGRPHGQDFQHWLEAEARCRPPESRA